MSSHGSRNVSAVSSNGIRQNTKDEYLAVGQDYDLSGSGGVSCQRLICGTKRRRITCYCASLALFLVM